MKLGRREDVASNRHVLEIRGLAVLREYQGRGLGRRLLGAAIDEARERGAAKLGLRVFEPNGSARALYARCGFEVVGVLRDEYRLEGHSVDDLLMELVLSSAQRPR